MVGDYGQSGEDIGCGPGGEFAIHLVNLQAGVHPWHQTYLSPHLRVFHDAGGSLRAFLNSGAWDAVCAAAERREIRSSDDLTALLIAGGLSDRSDFPVGHQPVCHCCGRPVVLDLTPAASMDQESAGDA